MKQLFRKKNIHHILADLAKREATQDAMHKNLSVYDLVAFGIAAIIGAGIFSTIGTAAFNGGPAVVFLFIFTAIACLFSALCYAEFASRVPISGSAYTYAYTTFGELIAWVLGWALVMEYAIGNITVAISWSDYFTGLLEGLGLHLPDYLTMDYLSAYRGNQTVMQDLASGKSLSDIPKHLLPAQQAWNTAPMIGGLRLIADLPALMIIMLITALVYVGIRESKTASNILVILKMAVIVMVILVGFFYVKPENWSPFAPNGVGGVLKGVASVFFAYVGFDAISTTAEECKDPRRDLPRAMIFSLIVCTVLYVCLALILTGMTPYSQLAVGDPLAFVFAQNGVDFVAGVVAVSAVVAMASVFLVFQLGQPRILMTMSRDGLLPPIFSKIHPRYKTPWFATIITGFLVAIPALFMNLTEVTDLAGISTLFAFTFVSGGVLLLETKQPDTNQSAGFNMPRYSGKWIVPGLLVGIAFGLYQIYPHDLVSYLSFQDIPHDDHNQIYQRGLTWLFIVVSVVMAILTFLKNLPLIPVLGILTNFYLMTALGIHNWVGFGVWMLVGLCIYAGYGYTHSKLRR